MELGKHIGNNIISSGERVCKPEEDLTHHTALDICTHNKHLDRQRRKYIFDGFLH
jgi:hypothetical protein